MKPASRPGTARRDRTPILAAASDGEKAGERSRAGALANGDASVELPLARDGG
jgi:hypothetical protein